MSSVKKISHPKRREIVDVGSSPIMHLCGFFNCPIQDPVMINTANTLFAFSDIRKVVLYYIKSLNSAWTRKLIFYLAVSMCP
jgi:hypothetical protein